MRRPRLVLLRTGDLGDTLLWIWELGWQHHWLTNGGDFWTSNQFYPSPENYAFGETLLGYFPFSVFKRYGIRKIVVVKAMPGATDILSRPASTLPLTRTESADVVEFAIQ